LLAAKDAALNDSLWKVRVVKWVYTVAIGYCAVVASLKRCGGAGRGNLGSKDAFLRYDHRGWVEEISFGAVFLYC